MSFHVSLSLVEPEGLRLKIWGFEFRVREWQGNWNFNV